jgi:hypothetical protein
MRFEFIVLYCCDVFQVEDNVNGREEQFIKEHRGS